ncbi:hypothetical protein MnTg01_00359 [archaeon MnTg01]|nr:hypothetical protein MnTg01_00359 [archaeon MnTg01]
MALPYLSSARLTNDFMVESSSYLIFFAKTLSSFKSELNKIVNKYSNALPFPVIPTFVRVEAGSSPRKISNALAFVEPL